jgi:predicted amidohydrolase
VTTETTVTIECAVIQLCSTPDKAENLEEARRLISTAAEKGAELIALPENYSFIGGDDEKLKEVEDIETGPSVMLLREMAVKHRVVIVGGSVPLRASEPSRVTNTCLVFNPNGDIIARYDKIHMFDIFLDSSTTYTESKYVEAGDQIVTFKQLGHTMGLSICYDVRFPELYRKLFEKGSEVLFVPAAFTIPTGKDHWEVLLRTRAIENQCYVVAPAQWGRHTEKRSSYGRSLVIDPWGQIIAQAPDKECVIYAELDFNYLKDVRRRLPALKHRIL